MWSNVNTVYAKCISFMFAYIVFEMIFFSSSDLSSYVLMHFFSMNPKNYHNILQTFTICVNIITNKLVFFNVSWLFLPVADIISLGDSSHIIYHNRQQSSTTTIIGLTLTNDYHFGQPKNRVIRLLTNANMMATIIKFVA